MSIIQMFLCVKCHDDGCSSSVATISGGHAVWCPEDSLPRCWNSHSTTLHISPPFSRVIEGKVSLTAGLIDAAERQSATLEILLTKYDASKNIKDDSE